MNSLEQNQRMVGVITSKSQIYAGRLEIGTGYWNSMLRRRQPEYHRKMELNLYHLFRQWHTPVRGTRLAG